MELCGNRTVFELMILFGVLAKLAAVAFVVAVSLGGVYAVVLDASATFDDTISAAPTILNIDFALSTFMAVLTSVDAAESHVTLDLCSPSLIFGSGCVFKNPVHLSAILFN